MKLIDVPKFTSRYKPVTSSSIYRAEAKGLTFDPSGLLSYEIFGTTAEERRRNYGYIDFKGVEAIDPVLFDNLKMDRNLKSIIFNEGSFILKAGELKKDAKGHTGLTFFKEILEQYKPKSTRVAETLDIIRANRGIAIIKRLIVPPAAYRETGNELTWRDISDLNQAYVDIVRIANSVRTSSDNNLYSAALQKNLQKVFIQLKAELASKEGIMRSNISGKRIDFSGRAVITLDNELDLDECAVPLKIAVKIFEPFLVAELKNQFKSTFEVYDALQDVYFNGTAGTYYKNIEKGLNNIFKTRLVILNRAPSLHKYSVMAFHPVLTTDPVIKVNPFVCEGFNADFDGDSVLADITLVTETSDITLSIAELEYREDLVEYKNTRTKEDGVVVTNYEPKQPLQIKAIDPDSGEIGYKPVLGFSKHENLLMYRIEDPQDRFKTFWASSDHSLLAYHEPTDTIVKITPGELLEHAGEYFIIKEVFND